MAHTHRCACGTTLTCPQEADKCAVVAVRWECPTCERRSLDAYLDTMLQELVLDQLDHTKTTRH